ncbi:IucA/IucC family siderophore biosynthesis protein [Salinicola corii]|uniref:IucA/IucC family siderophore biosynthesis protein n=1 Tax=Salinicola corii TaxID=2606937 RepID=A0A640WBY8_9GAMM|nr:IucA/IucC family protein [Salinicola corii]KAA0016965.1 IucA/IucC family siderophore biosynthesis protein [Salinicola corii]
MTSSLAGRSALDGQRPEPHPHRPDEAQSGDWLEDPVGWRHYPRIARRVTGQLLQTLLYEDVFAWRAFAREDADGATHDIHVTLDEGLRYRARGWCFHGFSLIRLDFASLRRCESAASHPEDGATSVLSLSQLLADLQTRVGADVSLERLTRELEQTLLHDLQSAIAHTFHPSPTKLAADALERYFIDAHSYHPCYKSRLGFSLADNARYGPEFGHSFAVVWLAVPRALSVAVSIDEDAVDAFLAAQAGSEVVARFDAWLAGQGRSADTMRLLPVHPWQWRHAVMRALHAEIADGQVAMLGQGERRYTPQQSIRTLAPVDGRAPYLKLAMNLTNTSSTRLLARHTVVNGPIVTRWLKTLIASDPKARERGFVLLGENVGVSLDERAFPERQYARVYGMTGALWRENVAQYLHAGERAVPFNGLTQLTRDEAGEPARPFIDPWVRRHGLEAWAKQVIEVASAPLLHLLYAEGIALESHGQNIVLIHRDGWPGRVALKDVHDGVRYSRAHLAHPECEPALEPVPPRHAALNRNSFLLTDDPAAVRDYVCDAFYFIALADLAVFLWRHYGLAESRFWQFAGETVLAYQQAHPEHAARFDIFDVFSPQWKVEALTRRRLFGDDVPQVKQVPNPLASWRAGEYE